MTPKGSQSKRAADEIKEAVPNRKGREKGRGGRVSSAGGFMY